MTELAPHYLLEPFAATRRGFRELVLGDNPAVASDFVLTIEGRYVTRLLAVRVVLTCDANAANREVVVQYRNPEDLVFARASTGVATTAGTTRNYYYNTGQPAVVTSVLGPVSAPLSGLWLPPGYDVRLHVDNAQAGDQLSGVRLYVERAWTDEAA